MGLRIGKSFKKIVTVAAGAAAVYFTGGAALPLLLKAQAMRKQGGAQDYSSLLNEAWSSSGLTNSLGLSGLVNQVGGLANSPLVQSYTNTSRAVLSPSHYGGGPGDEEEDDYDDEEEDDYA